MRSLELSSLRADLAAIDALLGARSKESDPIGWYQLSQRRKKVAQRLLDTKERADTRAGVALYFGGRPVTGSKGIQATFASKALETFQDMVAKRFAKQASGQSLSDRARVPMRNNSSLLITDVARGSFGFVLEEVEKQQELVDSSLKETVDEVSRLIHAMGSRDFDSMEDQAEILDDRLLLSLREFYKLLDEAGATMRIVDSTREHVLTRDAIEKGRARTDSIEWFERRKTIHGVLFITPNSQRFDFEPIPDATPIKGKVSKKCLALLRENGDQQLKRVLGSPVNATFTVKEVRSSHSEDSKFSYTLEEIELAQ